MTSGQKGNHDEGNQSGKASNWKDGACWWSEVPILAEQLSHICTGSNQKYCKRKAPHHHQQRADGLSGSVDSKRVTQLGAQECQDAGDDKKHQRQLQRLTTCVGLPGTILNHRQVPPAGGQSGTAGTAHCLWRRAPKVGGAHSTSYESARLFSGRPFTLPIRRNSSCDSPNQRSFVAGFSLYRFDQ